MITKEQIRQAEQHVEDMAAELRELQRRNDRGALSATSKLDDAWRAQSLAAGRLEVLRADFEVQETARSARAAAGQAAARALAPTVRNLEVSRAAAVEGVAAARAAIVHALAVVAAHDSAVRAASALLRTKGLRVGDDDETGGRADGGLHVAGEKWLPVDGPAVMSSVLADVVVEVHPQHPFARRPQVTLAGMAAAAGRDDLLSRLPISKRKSA